MIRPGAVQVINSLCIVSHLQRCVINRRLAAKQQGRAEIVPIIELLKRQALPRPLLARVPVFARVFGFAFWILLLWGGLCSQSLYSQSLDDLDALFDAPEAGTIDAPASGTGSNASAADTVPGAPSGEGSPGSGEGAPFRDGAPAGGDSSALTSAADSPNTGQKPGGPEDTPTAAPTERKVKEAPLPDLLEQFTREPLTVSGSVSTAIGGLAGYYELPPFNQPSQELLRALYRDLDLSGYAEFTNTLTFHSRMDRYTSVQGKIETSYPGFGIGITELFLTYVLWERYFFRIGKQAITWGNGRIYGDTNLTSGAEGGYSFKLTVPMSSSALTAVVMDNPAWRSASSPGIQDFTYALQLTVPVAGVEFLLEALYPTQTRKASGYAPRGVAGFKTTLWSVDLFHESLLTSRRQYTAVSGFFKEWGDPKIQLYGEHRARVTLPREPLVNLPLIGDKFEAGPLAPPAPADHQTSLNFLWKKFPWPQTDFGIRWNHAWRDNSGYIVPGLKLNNPFPNGSITLALSLYWGTESSVIASEFSDIDPRYRKFSLGFKISLSVGY